MKKIVRLTESDLSMIVRRVLAEKMGVPDNITQTAEHIFNEIYDNFSSDTTEYNPKQQPPKIELNGDYVISDYHFNTIYVFVTPKVHVDPNGKPAFLMFQVGSPQTVQNYRFVKSGTQTKFAINIVVAVGNVWSLSDVANSMSEEKDHIISVLSHELHHAYAGYKIPSESPEKKVEYQAVQSIKLYDIEPIANFLYYSYYIHSAEDIVRPSELYSLMRTKGITKSQFKEFFEESDMVKMLKNIRNFSLDGMIKDLYNYIPQIDKLYDFIEQDKDFPVKLKRPTTDKGKIITLLKIVFELLNRAKIGEYFNFLKSTINPLDLIATVLGGNAGSDPFKEQDKMMNDYIKKVRKHKNYQDFFVNEQKRFKFVADNRLRKLAKLYDMAKDDIQEKKDIVDWDLYHKINKTEEKTMKALKEMLRDMSKDDKEYSFLIKNKKKNNSSKTNPSK